MGYGTDARSGRGGRALRRLSLLTLGVPALARPAAAHTGTTHAGTPHWFLFVLFLGGIGAVVLSAVAVRHRLASVRAAVAGLLVGAGAILFGGIGLVELQVVAQTPPRLTAYYPLASLLVGGLLAVGGSVLTLRRWPEKPQYLALCLILAWWIVYPTVMPNQGYLHPFGYLLAFGLPVTLGYIVWTDGRALLQSLVLQRRPLIAGIVAAFLFDVFFAFSAGTMSVNPDDGVNLPSEAFVVPFDVASPLVVWPAIEWYFPSIPFSGYVSVGTVLLMGTLGGLVGLNAAVLAQQWTASAEVSGTKTFTGTLAASGATACCCCAPAFYGVLSVLFGAATTPVYWSFMIPSSPVGGAFFAASVLLLLGSFLQSAGGSATQAATEA
jgi:hypothetical protein